MREYGAGLAEVRTWTFGQMFLLLSQMTARYQAQKNRSKKRDVVELTEESIVGSEWEKG